MDTKVKVRWVSAALWVFSWRIVYLEIFRWRHMTRTLRFKPPAGVENARAGLPVRAARACAVLSPLIFLATHGSILRCLSPTLASRTTRVSAND